MVDTELLKQHLSEASVTNIAKWLNEPKYALYKADLEEMIAEEQWQALEDAFFKVVEFGTGGRRGTTGVGSNRINKVTIGESAQALCLYAASFDPEAPTKGIAIACDTRLSSPELSKFTAQVCAANGFKTYLFENFRSTPELSFAVRELGCAVGIVISASHNQPADNGFKAYWSDGAQLVAPHDKGVLEMGNSITEIHTVDFDAAVEAGDIVIIGSDMDEKYITAAVAQAETTARDVKIVYSPLHGTGQTNTLPVLRAAGFTQVATVDSQMTPDGNFPTVENGKANPEAKVANDRAVAQMLADEADIAITNDPDADRIGVMVREGEDVMYLTGNQIASLAADFTLRHMHDKGTLTPKHFIAKTLVTTDLLEAIAGKYDVRVYGNMLVGFKFIAETLRKKEAQGETFVMGAEESFGMLKGSFVRDKDGAMGALPLAEYAAELKTEGKTLGDRMFELYAEHGVYAERLEAVVCVGASGFQQMQQIMAALRERPLSHVGPHQVTAVRDYASLVHRNLTTGQETSIDCTAGNVVVVEFGDTRRRFTVRPSGTEPILKLYVQWYEDAEDDTRAQFAKLQTHLEGLSKEFEGLVLELGAS